MILLKNATNPKEDPDSPLGGRGVKDGLGIEMGEIRWLCAPHFPVARRGKLPQYARCVLLLSQFSDFT